MRKLGPVPIPEIGLSRRAATALAVSAVSLFLLLCLATYGREEAEVVRRSADAGIAPTIAGSLVTVCGAGSWVVAILGLAWGVIVYFQERTPDLVLRGVGTALLAVSTAMLAGLVASNDGERALWAGTVGTAASRALHGWGTPGMVFGWLSGLALFAVSLVFATDWLFHTVRRGAGAGDALAIPTEPSRGDLLDDPAEAQPRQFVRTESRASAAADSLAREDFARDLVPDMPPPPIDPEFIVSRIEVPVMQTPPAPVEPLAELPAGWSRSKVRGRDVVHAPQGYAGVEFLSTSDELAEPAGPAASYSSPDMVISQGVPGFVDEFDLDPIAVSRVHLYDDAEPAAPEMPKEPPPRAEAPRAEAPREEAPLAEAPEERFPTGGIGFADPALFLDDEVFALDASPFRDEGTRPHDGASAAGEIASAYAAPAARAPLAEPPAPEPAPEAEDASPPAEGAFLEDDVLIGTTLLADDEMLFAGAPAAPETPVPPAPAAAEEAEEFVVPPTETADAPFAAVAERPSEVERAPAFEPWDFPQVDGRDADDEPPAEMAGEVAVEPAVDVEFADVALPIELPTLAPITDEASLSPDLVRSVVASVQAPAVEPPAYRAPIVDVPAPEPLVAAAPAEPTPVAAAPAPMPPAAPAPQLALFPPPTCDLSKLVTLELDPLFHAAADAILGRGRASAVVLQRTLGIGYARALRILDQMSSAGMLGPDTPGGSREICFTREQWDSFRA